MGRIPRHFGYFGQPQKGLPLFSPFLTLRSTMPPPQKGHDGLASAPGFLSKFPALARFLGTMSSLTCLTCARSVFIDWLNLPVSIASTTSSTSLGDKTCSVRDLMWSIKFPLPFTTSSGIPLLKRPLPTNTTTEWSALGFLSVHTVHARLTRACNFGGVDFETGYLYSRGISGSISPPQACRKSSLPYSSSQSQRRRKQRQGYGPPEWCRL